MMDKTTKGFVIVACTVVTVAYPKKTVDQIIAIISERPGVIHFHVARELELKPRELDEWLRTIGTKDYHLLHHEERWWTNDPRWIETAALKELSGFRKALDEHRRNYLKRRGQP